MARRSRITLEATSVKQRFSWGTVSIFGEGCKNIAACRRLHAHEGRVRVVPLMAAGHRTRKRRVIVSLNSGAPWLPCQQGLHVM